MKAKKLVLIFALLGVSLLLGQNAEARVDTSWPEKLSFTCSGNNCYVDNLDLNDGEMTFAIKNVFHRQDLPTDDRECDATLRISGNEQLGYNAYIMLRDKSSRSSLPEAQVSILIAFVTAVLTAAVIWYHYTSTKGKSRRKRRR